MQNSLRFSINSPFWVMVCLVLLALALYGRALGFEYVWDDNSIFLGTVASLSKSNSFFSTLSAPFLGNLEYFRPLAVMTFYWDVCIAGYNPYFSHGVNLAFFIANTLLVFFLGKCIAEKIGRSFPVRIGFLAALLYVTHPAMTEATLWISGRFDLLATLFILSASLLYVSGCTEKVKTLGVPLLVLLGLFCKETAALFPLAAFCLWMAVSPPQGKEGFYQRLWRENRRVIIGIFAVFLVYLVLRLQAEGESYTRYLGLMDEQYFREKLFLAVESLRFYLGQSFLPFPVISPQHPVDYVLAARVMPGFLAYPLLLAFLSGLFFCAIRKKSPSAWLFIAGLSYLLLVLHVAPFRIGKNLSFERYLTATLAFWAIAVALMPYGRILAFPAVMRVFSSMHFLSAHRLAGLVLGLWLLSSAFVTSLAVPVWKNSLSLWGWNYTLYPENDIAINRFMLAAISMNRPDVLDERAVKKFQDAPPNPVYGSFLLMKRDPATLEYLETLIHSDQMFRLHEDFAAFESMKQENSAARVDHFRPIPVTASYSYSLYSEAVLLFDKDPQKALELDDITRKYASIIYDERYVELWIGYRRAAYLYALGRFEEADAFKGKIASLMTKEQYQTFNESIASILAYYCKNSDKVSCEPFLSRGLLSEETLRQTEPGLTAVSS